MDNQDNTVWFAATTRNGQWKKIALTLSRLGVTFYIPKVYNTLLFLHTPKQRALSLVNSGEISARFLIDHSTHTLLEVPQKQMEDFMRVLDENPDAECVNDFSFAKVTASLWRPDRLRESRVKLWRVPKGRSS